MDKVQPDDFKLSRPPVVEALAELHFNKASNYVEYSLVPGRMFERLRTTYPQASDLDAANLPLSIEPIGRIVRHRFTSEDGQRLFQVGNGVVTVNCLTYETYAVFRSQVLEVVEHATALMGPPTRAILRYINKIPTGGLPTDQVLRFGLALPAAGDKDWFRQQATCARLVSGIGELQMTRATPADGRSDLLLFDLQLTSEPMAEDASQALTAWMDAAHREVEDEFLSDLHPEFLESIT